MALKPELLRRARLIAFTTDVIVPPAILDQFGYGAYNFHPGPPHFPCWAPALFAIDHRATEFGVIAHIMTERVDEGAIVGVELFPIPMDTDLHGLEELACVHLAHLFWGLAKWLATQMEPLPELPKGWSGKKIPAQLCRHVWHLSQPLKVRIGSKLKARAVVALVDA